MQISAVIITRDEENNIADAIGGLDWADEVIVVDSGSTDRTVEIAKGLGAKVIARDWTGFAEQKRFAAETASHDWVFSLDADERVSPELRRELIRLKDQGAANDGYLIPRLSIYLGREIRHGGWYPDRQLRLFDRRKGNWNANLVHESVQMAAGAAVGKLKGDLLHYSVTDASHHHRMIGERYAPLAAKQMYDAGRRSSYLTIAAAAPLAFIRSYVLKLGFLDGIPGLAIASFAAHHAFLKHLLLWEIQSAENSPRD
ncbi:MAG: glycosyltransferase family 2 protein [Chloracidobacterium sp.]|nr:glycosyltransferase family 2 protein [Chloracidobacterium sp.]